MSVPDDADQNNFCIDSSVEVLPVRVVARVRPLLQSELLESSRLCVSFPACGQTLVLGKDRAKIFSTPVLIYEWNDRVFTFDAVYTPSASQEAIHREWVSPLVDGCLDGYNATVLAYGQTGSGKTYTMGTGNNFGKSEEEIGVIPRVMQEIYRKLDESWLQKKGQQKIGIKVSYIEIYNDEIKDLLHPSTLSKTISIRERADGTIVLAGVKEVEVENLAHMQQLLEDGSECRTVAGTLMNTHSSRSHSIFTIIVEQTRNRDSITAKFHLVDLAGSERAKRTGNVGLRLKESVNINAGLLALGNVISALGDEKKKASHVPYRESKLTRMLQDSLGGNSRTLMIACISPSDPSFEETLNTLKYANRARNIKNKPIVNRNPEDVIAQEAQTQEIARLKEELEDEISSRLRNDEFQAEIEILALKLAKAEASVKRLGEQNFQLMAEKEQALMKAEIAQSQMASLGEHVRRLNETRSLRNSLRASLETVEHQLLSFGVVNDKGARVQAGEDRPSTAPIASKKESCEDERVRELRMKAEQAHAELAAKTRELELLEAALTGSNARAAKSVSDMYKNEEDSEKRFADITAQQNTEARSVIERNLRKIRRLEDDLKESEQIRESLAAQVSELRADLARDEEIFAQKQEEIQRLHSQLVNLSSQLQALPQQELVAVESAKKILDVESRNVELQNSKSAPLFSNFGGTTVDPRMSSALGNDEGFSVTMQQQGNVRMASLLDEDDLVRVGDDLEDTVRLNKSPGQFCGAGSGIKPDVLEKGFAVLEAEKARLAEEKRLLEEHAHSMTRRFHMDQHHAEKRVKALEFNMQLKQDLIRNLVRTEQDLQVVNEHQQDRIKELEHDIATMRTERDRSSVGGHGTSRSRPEDMTPEHRRTRDHLTAKLRAREAELESLKKQQEESIRVLKTQDQKEKRIKALEAEVSKLAQQSEQVKTKAKAETERFEKMRTNFSSKLHDLKYQLEMQVRDLQQENERQREALQRKNDELDGVRSALKGPDKFDVTEGENPSSNRSWLDNEIGEFLSKKHAIEKLEKELKQRESIIAAKETALRRRAGLQLKQGRKEEEVRQSMRGLEERISQISEQIHTCHKSSMVSDPRECDLSETENIDMLRIETVQLQKQREDAVRTRDALEQTLKLKSYLDDEDEAQLAEVEERLEGLDMEIEYKSQAISELQQEVLVPSRGVQKLEAIINGAALQNLGVQETEAMLGECVQRVVKLSALLREKDRELNTMKLQEEELTDQIQNLRAAELDADRRLTQVQREHETRMQFLVEQLKYGPSSEESDRKQSQGPTTDTERFGGERTIRALEEQVSMLDKDNFYYKQSNTNLKRRLRELSAGAEQDREALVKATMRVSALEAQLSNLKGYVQTTVGAAHVRLSKQDLRPLTAEDVQALRASKGGS